MASSIGRLFSLFHASKRRVTIWETELSWRGRGLTTPTPTPRPSRNSSMALSLPATTVSTETGVRAAASIQDVTPTGGGSVTYTVYNDSACASGTTIDAGTRPSCSSRSPSPRHDHSAPRKMSDWIVSDECDAEHLEKTVSDELAHTS